MTAANTAAGPRVHGLLIDPQNDFCDPSGALYVPGADADMTRLAALLHRLGPTVAELHVTLDAHQYADIAHPVWWIDPATGAHPEPFTIVTRADVDAGRWAATLPEARERSRAYVAALEADGRYPLCIWPPHCLIGTPGQAVYAPVADALRDWADHTARPVGFVTKGESVWTEHYSAIKAEVPDPADPHTQPNRALLDGLLRADVVFIAGEAGSHCLANTVRDALDAVGDDDRLLRKLVLLTDATSPVPGFEGYQRAFLDEMTARGLRTATTETFDPEAFGSPS